MTTTEKPTKKQTGVRLDPELMKRLKHLSVDLDISLTDLFKEAIEDLLAKRSKK